MRIKYTKPELVDISQSSRIAFARQFRFMTQDDVSDKLGLTGECKRRTMTRYEKGNRNPKDDRTSEIAKILDININAIKKHDYKEPIDLLYTLMWLEELIQNIIYQNYKRNQKQNKSTILMNCLSSLSNKIYLKIIIE